MKKLLCLALSTVFVALSFVSCSTPTKSYSPKITVSSSDAVSDAEYLTNRLGNLTDNVYLGIGSDDFDMTGFENDGYIIRSSGGEAVIIGKTPEGLTNGVRKYANHAESGTSGELDISYHEGYRVEKFTLAGVDIAEYAIEYPESYNENMKFAVDEFIQLTEKACGVKLSSSVGITHRKYAIEFRHSTDGELESTGYRYFFEGSRFVIEGAVERGCMYGVYRFFKNELDWMGLVQWDLSSNNIPDSVLAESEHIDIPADTFATETSFFYFFRPYLRYKCGRVSDVTNSNFAVNTIAMHGLQSNSWGGYDFSATQPCYSDEVMYSDIFEDIRSYVEKEVASGKEIGKALTTVDIAQGDNLDHCLCNDCQRVFRNEGNTHAGSVVRFANRISEDMEASGFGGLNYLIFAYAGTQKPPKTAPRPEIVITMCFDGSCSGHPIASGECPSNFISSYFLEQRNSDLATWVKGWGQLSDNVNVWYYLLDLSVDQYTVLKTVYEDIKFLMECNANGIFIESETYGLGIMWTVAELVCEMNWKPDMTRAEYESYLCKILEKEYGDGWGEIREYIDIWQEAQERSGYCWHCWGFDFTDDYHQGQYSTVYVADRYDYCVELIDRAISLACDSREIRNCEMFAIHVLYQGCYSSYFKEYDEGDTERLAVLNERYDRMIALLKKYGISPDKLNWSLARIEEKMEDQAWKTWVKVRDYLPHGESVRSAP